MRLGLALYLAGALTVSGCGEQKPEATETSTRPDIAELQLLADEACACEMQGGEEADCWLRFERVAESIPSEGFGTSSFPLSYETMCFPDSEGDCVGLGGRLVGDEEGLVCTAKQQREIEALHATVLQESDNNMEKADAAAASRIRQMSAELGE